MNIFLFTYILIYILSINVNQFIFTLFADKCYLLFSIKAPRPTSKHDLQDQHDHHDGAGLHLPLSLRQSPGHLRHQACGGLAPLQPGLPSPGDTGQCPPPGRFTSDDVILQYLIN